MIGNYPIGSAVIGSIVPAVGVGAQTIQNAGAITSAEAFGNLTVNQNVISAGGIVSAEAFGMANANLNVHASGIASAEAFGVSVINQNITAAGGIVSAEAFGSLTVNQNIISAGAIVSAEAFGNATVTAGAVEQAIQNAGGIASAEAFGTAEIYTEGSRQWAGGWITHQLKKTKKDIAEDIIQHVDELTAVELEPFELPLLEPLPFTPFEKQWRHKAGLARLYGHKPDISPDDEEALITILLLAA